MEDFLNKQLAYNREKEILASDDLTPVLVPMFG